MNPPIWSVWAGQARRQHHQLPNWAEYLITILAVLLDDAEELRFRHNHDHLALTECRPVV
jgi:hypothetical protein